MKKRSVIEIIKGAINGFVKNPILLVPALLVLVAMWLGSFLIAYMFLIGLDLAVAVPITIVLALAMIFAMFYFGLGGLGMVKEIVDKKKAKWANINTYWNKFWIRYVGVNVALMLITLGIGAVAIALGYVLSLLIGGANAALIVTAIILGLIAILVMLLFLLAPYVLLTENRKVGKTIKRSVEIAKKNYGSLLGLFASFFFVSILLQLIPLGQIGNIIWQIVVGVVIGVVQSIALMTFASERR